MPNPRMNAAKMKAEALRKARANKMKSKMGTPLPKKGEVKKTAAKTKAEVNEKLRLSKVKKAKAAKPANAVKNTKVYKTIKSTSTYKPKFEKLPVDDKDLKLQKESPNKNKGEVKGKTQRIRAKKKKVNEKLDKTSAYKKDKKNTVTGKKSNPKFKTLMDKEMKLTDKLRKSKAKDSALKMSGRSYDIEKAYDKNLPMSERFHYLENERNDKRNDAPGKMKGSPYHMNYNDSPLDKTLVGNQKNLPEHLRKKIEAAPPAPQMKGSPYHMSNELKYGGPVIDQMKTLSQTGASKVLRHMKK